MIMQLSQEFIEELELLNLFSLDSPQGGLKIHHDADPVRIASAKRLFAKHIITLEDGGYLTPLGVQAAEHVQALLAMLAPLE